jgi:hypothetical protein
MLGYTAMAKPLKYKKPRKINAVSIGLVFALLVIVYLTYQYLPLFLLRQEAYRVLDEISSEYTATAGRFMAEDAELDKLTAKLSRELRRVGVRDPDMEHWIEPNGENEVAIGVIYSDYIEWPMDLIPKQERVAEIELMCNRIQRGSAWTCAATTADAGQR